MQSRRLWARWRSGALALTLLAAGCGASSEREGANRGGGGHDARASIASPEASARLADLRARFVVQPPKREPLGRPGPTHNAASRAVIGPGIASGFNELSDGLRAVVPDAAKRAVLKSATVTLPARANESVELEDDASHVAVRFSLRGAADTPVAIAQGIAMYRGAFSGSDVVHRVNAEGTEDFVIFEEKPEREELVYEIDISRVAGLRLVSNTLEFLDKGGAPRLRVAPPYVVDEKGAVREATLAVEDCAFDAKPSGPWGRPITRPGAARCTLHVAWSGSAYPLLVDPIWNATGSMTNAREYHTATLLPSGNVLLAGGTALPPPSSAELFDPAGGGSFAATGSMSVRRYQHTATALPSGEVLVVGGVSASTLSSAELYDPTAGTFSATGSMATARASQTATLLASGEVLVAGGMATDDDSEPLDSAELFDPTGVGSFAATGLMTTPRGLHTATLLDSGSVLMAGGFGPSGLLASAELYDPSGAGTFSLTGPMAAGRVGHSATLLGSRLVLVAGGYGLSSAELFDPSAGRFSATGSLPFEWGGQTATLLISGKVLIAGGGSVSFPMSDAALFDPSGAGTFSTIDSMTTARANHTATLMTSGQVLVAGGAQTSNFLSSAELAFELAGAACATDDDCVSEVCVGGFCCSGPCGGAAGTLTCGPAGACKLTLAQSCPGGDSDCASAHCADGVCCNVACTEACVACSAAQGASADGQCTIQPQGSLGRPACGNGFVCDGASSNCPGPTCASDDDCLPSDYCDATGRCVASRAQGTACDLAADCITASSCRACTTGHCIDGVCCDQACTSLCQACAAPLKQSGKDDGVCDNAKAQTNPHDDACPDDGTASCKRDGLCDGAGACAKYYPAGTSCGASTCGPDNKASGQLCDGMGACTFEPGGTACGDYQCRHGSCPTTCAKSVDCIDSDYCNSGACVAREANGAPCSTSDACISTFCVDENCCDTVCNGQYACVNGSCQTTCAGQADCVATAYCQEGECLSRGANGAPCTSGDACSSTYCVDGNCCESACAGQCEACDVGGSGSCVPISGAPHGSRPECSKGSKDDPCSQELCDGHETMACTGFASSEVKCRDASCAEGIATAAGVCDGKGSCSPAETSSCEPYLCKGNACASPNCTTDADCATKFRCDPQKKECVAKSAATCDGEHTIHNPDGTTLDCTPYQCESPGECRTSCTTTADCAAPNVCDATRTCLPPPSTSDAVSEGGCSIAGLGAVRDSDPPIDPRFACLAAGACALSLRRRRIASRDGRLPPPSASSAERYCK